MCVNCNDNKETFIKLIGDLSGKEVILKEGDDISITKNDLGNKVEYTISYSPYIPLVISSFSQEASVQLKGTAVSTIIFNFSFNRPIQSGRITSSSFLANKTFTITGATSYSDITVVTGELVGGEITANASFTLYADDDITDGRAEKSSVTSLVFGNYIYIGKLSDVDENTDDNDLITAVQGLSKFIATSRVTDFTCIGETEDEYEIFASPVSLGAVNFKDDDNPTFGGFYLINTLDIPNGNGFTESYYIYRSTYGNLNGAHFTTS